MPGAGLRCLQRHAGRFTQEQDADFQTTGKAFDTLLCGTLGEHGFPVFQALRVVSGQPALQIFPFGFDFFVYGVLFRAGRPAA